MRVTLPSGITIDCASPEEAAAVVKALGEPRPMATPTAPQDVLDFLRAMERLERRREPGCECVSPWWGVFPPPCPVHNPPTETVTGTGAVVAPRTVTTSRGWFRPESYPGADDGACCTVDLSDVPQEPPVRQWRVGNTLYFSGLD